MKYYLTDNITFPFPRRAASLLRSMRLADGQHPIKDYPLLLFATPLASTTSSRSRARNRRVVIIFPGEIVH